MEDIKMKWILLIIVFVSLVFTSCATRKNVLLETEIGLLKDRIAVETVVQNLFNGTDKLDWERVEKAFAKEVLFDMTALAGGEPVTMKAIDITSAWDDGLKNLDAIHHQIGQVSIRLDSDKANVFCYGTASHYLPTEGAGNVRVFVGEYDLVLKRTKNIWRITEFKFVPKYIDGNLNLGS